MWSICSRYRDNYNCSHALSVAIIENAIHRYAQSFSRIVKTSLTAIASKYVGKTVGQNKSVKERKRTKAYTLKKVSLKYNNIQSFGSNNPVGLQSESSTIPSIFQPQATSRFSHAASNTCFQLTVQTSSSPNLHLTVQRFSDQLFALSFRDGTLTNCWHLLFQIMHIECHQQHHNLLHPSIVAQVLKFDSTMIRTFWASTKIFLLTPYAA